MKHVCIVLLLLIVCGCGDIPKQISAIKAHKLKIPASEMVAWSSNDSKCTSATDSRFLSLVFYVSETQCQSCFFSQLIKYERENYDSLANHGINFLYIFDSPNINIEILEEELKDARIRGRIYIDTCKAFLNKNLHIPDNPLYHTLVIDNSGNTIMVGNPFQNSRMNNLFKKVVEDERKRKDKSMLD